MFSECPILHFPEISAVHCVTEYANHVNYLQGHRANRDRRVRSRNEELVTQGAFVHACKV